MEGELGEVGVGWGGQGVRGLCVGGGGGQPGDSSQCQALRRQ